MVNVKSNTEVNDVLVECLMGASILLSLLTALNQCWFGLMEA